MTVTNIEQEILGWFNEPLQEEDHETEISENVWYEFYETLSTEAHTKQFDWAKTPVLASGPAFVVEDFGGEGQGETRYVVFSVGEQFFRVDGYYASWDGTTWEDPTPHEVVAKEVTSIEYVRA